MQSRELIAWNLRKYRVTKGFSQEGLALEAGIARTYVSRLERGLENPTIGLLDQVASTLGISTISLLAPRIPGEKQAGSIKAGRKPTRKKLQRKRRT